jgi:predicted GNAT family N-acyltransferase
MTKEKMRIQKVEGITDSAKSIREEVFVKEQGFVDEFDETDQKATHIILYNEKDRPIATCRVFTENDPNAYILGRLAVVKDYRGEGLGSYVVEQAEKCVCEKGGKSISLHAQYRAKEFYQKLGYQEYGPIENEQGCPHIWMKKRMTKTVENGII